MLSKLLLLDALIAQIERILVQVICLALTLILMTQVILRYGFSRPLFWAEEISVQLLVFMTLFGVGLLIHKQQLIAIDIVSSRIRGRAKTYLDLLLCTVATVVVGAVAMEATQWVLRPEVQVELSPTTQLPIWYSYAMLPTAFYFMLVHQLTALVILTKRMILGGAA
jgi:TRAP-type C4-dicarboxylate transport system permease small subunit